MSEPSDLDRRDFFATAAIGFAAAQFVMSGSANAQSSTAKPSNISSAR